MAQWLRSFAAPVDGGGSVPSTHMGLETSKLNSRGHSGLFCPLRASKQACHSTCVLPLDTHTYQTFMEPGQRTIWHNKAIGYFGHTLGCVLGYAC